VQRTIFDEQVTRLSAHLDSGFGKAHFQTEIDGGNAIRLDADCSSYVSSKSRVHDLEIVNAQIDRIEPVDPGFVAAPVVRRMPVCWLVKAAFAPLMAAPEESSTVPVTVPRLVWLWAVAINASQTSNCRKIRAILHGHTLMRLSCRRPALCFHIPQRT
jgi:hypothetical protein